MTVVERVGVRRGAVVVALAATSPVLFLLGGLAAGAAQPPGAYDAIGQTVSTLAGRGAADRWIMAAVLATMGVIYLLVAVGLRGVTRSARLVLGVGGIAAVVAALAAQPVHGSSTVHMAATVTAVVAFVLWTLPLAADRTLDPGLRRGSLVAAAVLTAGLAWLCAQAWTDGTWLGMAERVLILAQTVWPIRVATAVWRGPSPARSDAGWVTAALAVLAPLVLVVGLAAAQAAWPGPDPWSQSFSALAGLGAPQRWIMTLTLVVGATLHVLVAAGLRHRVPTPAWALLAAGGVFLLVTGLNPQPVAGYSAVHMVAGGLAWLAYTLWPLGLARSPAIDPALRRGSAVAVAVLAVLVAWFAFQLITSGPWYGPSQRVVLLAQTVWPVVVAVRVPRPVSHHTTITPRPDGRSRSS
jgi:hypothetical membrane protein